MQQLCTEASAQAILLKTILQHHPAERFAIWSDSEHVRSFTICKTSALQQHCSAAALHYSSVALQQRCIAAALHCIALQQHCIATALHCNIIALQQHCRVGCPSAANCCSALHHKTHHPKHLENTVTIHHGKHSNKVTNAYVGQPCTQSETTLKTQEQSDKCKCRSEGGPELCELQQSPGAVQMWHDPPGAQRKPAPVGASAPLQLLLLQEPSPQDQQCSLGALHD